MAGPINRLLGDVGMSIIVRVLGLILVITFIQRRAVPEDDGELA